jgi:hypothetical protein
MAAFRKAPDRVQIIVLAQQQRQTKGKTSHFLEDAVKTAEA